MTIAVMLADGGECMSDLVARRNRRQRRNVSSCQTSSSLGRGRPLKRS